MFIESLRVQGFKSLADVELRNLAAVNVFHGLNDVGKSNILQALDLLAQLLPIAVRALDEQMPTILGPRDLWPYSETIFRQPDGDRIVWDVAMRWPPTAEALACRLTLTRDLRLYLTWGEPPPLEVQQALADPAHGFNLVSADRRLGLETLDGELEIGMASPRARRPAITARNLKRALFDAFASPNREQRGRFARLQQLLLSEFVVGELDAALLPPREIPRARVEEPSRYVRDIAVRFRRADMDVLVEDVGSGIQQLLLLLGQIFFNPARNVGIEEPEMNLCPAWQARLMALFRGLIAPDPGGLDQVFISSHSPEFEAAEHFYDVTYQNGATVVTQRPLVDRRQYFAALGVPEELGEDLGPYLNSQGQIKLPQRVVDSLGLRPREPVFFYQTPDGHWQLRTRDELLARFAEAEADDDDANRAG